MTSRNEDYDGRWPVLFAVAAIVGAITFVTREYNKTHQCLEWQATWIEEQHIERIGKVGEHTIPAHWSEACVRKGKP